MTAKEKASTARVTLDSVTPDNWELLSKEDQERLFFRLFPDDAYQWLIDLRDVLRKTKEQRDESDRLVNLAIKGWQECERRQDETSEERTDLAQALAKLQRRSAALDQKAATAANSRRRIDVECATRDYVFHRIDQDPGITTKELAFEAQTKAWARRNKKGKALALSSLRRKIGPILAEAKARRKKRQS